MKLKVEPLIHTTETYARLPTETSISCSTFRTLPMDIQMDYARFYKLPGAEMLTSKEICDSLFKDTDWTPVVEIEGHFRLATAGGVVVAKEVMDLVDWLLEHPKDAASRDMDTHIQAHDGEDASNVNHERLAYGNLQRLAEDFQRAHNRIKAAVEESRQAVRQTCADIFILQSQLDTEDAYQSTITETITNIVGAEVMQGIENQLDMAGMEGGLSSGSTSNVARIESERRRTSTTHHVVTVPAGRMSLKRTREAEANFNSPHISKRPRRVEPSTINNTSQSPTNPCLIPRTILNYSSHDEGTDGTYSDSNGTEQDFVDDPYSYHDSRGRSPDAELSSSSNRTESSDEGSKTDQSQNGVPWRTMADFADDSSDSEYQPHGWDLEDVWELDNARRSSEWTIDPLFQFNFANELRDCDGVLSDAGLSTDDPDEGYHDFGIVQRPSARLHFSERRFPQSLAGPLLIYPTWEDELYYPSDADDETIARMKETAILSAKLTPWRIIKDHLLHHRYPKLDLEQRLADVLGSDHAHFYFDDQEWRCFVEPPPSTRDNTIKITTSEGEALKLQSDCS